jgi:hypothetical protein
MEKWSYSSTILNIGATWRRVVSVTPPPLYPRGESPGAYCIGGWIGLRTGLDIMEKIKVSCFYQESNPDSLVMQPLA